MNIPDTTATSPRMWYLAVCRGCPTEDELSFDSFGDRNEWAGLHVAATGHVVSVRQWLGYDPTKTAPAAG